MFSHRIDDEAELRLIEPRHAEQLNALIEQNRAHIKEWSSWARHMTRLRLPSRLSDNGG